MNNKKTDKQASTQLDRELIAELEQKINSYALKSYKLTNQKHYVNAAERKDK